MDGVHYYINLVKGCFSNYVLKKAQNVGLCSGQPRVLEYLITNDGCSQRDICNAWELDRSTVAGLVKRMERDGLLRTTAGEKDKRMKRVWLTQKGRDLWLEMSPAIQHMNEVAFDGFSKEEQEVFMDMLVRMHENLKNLE